jgi:amidase
LPLLAHPEQLFDRFLEDALVRAHELDEYYREHGKTIGPLHGLPVSAKDQVTLRGRITSLSFLSMHAQATPAETDAQLAQILQDAGAVIFVHTTLCQTIMHLEGNSFWGRTLNGFNTSLTSGGSSCGEGALVGMHGSPLGLGTDSKTGQKYCGVLHDVDSLLCLSKLVDQFESPQAT